MFEMHGLIPIGHAELAEDYWRDREMEVTVHRYSFDGIP